MKKVLWTCKILRNEDNSGNVIQGLKMNLGIYEHELDDENRDLLRKLIRFPDQTRVRCCKYSVQRRLWKMICEAEKSNFAAKQ